MPWDMSPSVANIAHLRLARKVLRLGPNDSSRTFLLIGLPHGVPTQKEMPAEIHDHFEEMFMLQGQMWTPEGLSGPAPISIGRRRSSTGRMFRKPASFRSCGPANYVRTTWTEPMPLPIGQAYAPKIPAGTPESWTREWSGPALY